MIEENELLLKNESFFLLENKRKWHISRISSKDMPEKRRVNEHLYCINCVSEILPKYGKNVRKSMLILLGSLKRWDDVIRPLVCCVQVFVERCKNNGIRK